MLEREQWILGLSIAILLVAAATLILIVRKHYERSDTDTVLDAVDDVGSKLDARTTSSALEHQAVMKNIDLTRDHVDEHSIQTGNEHKDLSKQNAVMSARLQFLTAKEIAAEERHIREAKEERERDRQEAKGGEPT